MKKKKVDSTLERQLFFSFVGGFTALLLLYLGITLYFDINRQNREIDASISSIAAYIASMESVAQMLQNGYPNEEVKNALDSLAYSFSDLNVILICDNEGLRYYHTSRQVAGDSFVTGEEAPILAGGEPYITTGYGTYGTQRRAFHGIANSDGYPLGFVMTSVFTAGIWERNWNLVMYGLLVVAAVFLVGLVLSRWIVGFLTRSLMGHHPAELLNLYLQQDDVLSAIEEGLIATDMEGHVIFSNPVARRLVQGDETPLRNRRLNEVFPETACMQVAANGISTYNRSCTIHGHQVLVSEIPIRGEIGYRGVLNIFHDKTEMIRMSDELSGTKNMLDTLRFFNHEFMNKLHIILGHLQTGETKKAIEFIINSSLVSSQAIRETADAIRVSPLCALLIGKMMYAAELEILLTIAPGSYCMEDDLLIPVDDCITIIGNLLENAIEEINSSQPKIREINLGIYCRSDCNLFVCEDTGNGIQENLRPYLFEKGASSKGETRGLGLYLIQQLVERHGGSIEIETEKQAGTCFTLTFTRKEVL